MTAIPNWLPKMATFVECQDDADAISRVTTPGAFTYLEQDTRFFFCCMCGCGRQISLPIVRAYDPKRSGWGCNMSRTAPSLEPSVRRLDDCKWHGHLINGQWTSCEDTGR